MQMVIMGKAKILVTKWKNVLDTEKIQLPPLHILKRYPTTHLEG